MYQIAFALMLLLLLKAILISTQSSKNIYLNNQKYALPNTISTVTINNDFNGTKLASRPYNSINYASLKNTKNFPLEHLFKITVYRLNVNSSSPCNYTGKELRMKCHKVLIFDSIRYQNAIKELQQSILSRIGLKNEPNNFNFNQNTMKLLNGIKENFKSSANDADESIKRTEFDKQELNGKTVKIIRELTGINHSSEDESNYFYSIF